MPTYATEILQALMIRNEQIFDAACFSPALTYLRKKGQITYTTNEFGTLVWSLVKQ